MGVGPRFDKIFQFLILTLILTQLSTSWNHVLCDQYICIIGLTNAGELFYFFCGVIHSMEIESTEHVICYLEQNDMQAIMKFNCALYPVFAAVNIVQFYW